MVLGAVSGCQTAEPDAPQDQLPTETTISATAVRPAATAEIAAPPADSATVAATATMEATAVQEAEDQADTATPPPSATPTETPIPVNPVNSVGLEPVLQGVFTQPLYLTHAGDERLFVVEQAGVIRIVEQGQLLETPFLDIRDRVGSSQLEQGLLGLAFHPEYASNGAFFVNYTDKSGNTRISRFMVSQDDANLADPNSEAVLLTYQQPYPNHNGGQVAFGPDGYLYIGAGDGGSANDPLGNGQNPTTILGSLLRLDVNQLNDTYLIPATNPFVGSDEGLNEIWAWDCAIRGDSVSTSLQAISISPTSGKICGRKSTFKRRTAREGKTMAGISWRAPIVSPLIPAIQPGWCRRYSSIPITKDVPSRAAICTVEVNSRSCTVTILSATIAREQSGGWLQRNRASGLRPLFTIVPT